MGAQTQSAPWQWKSWMLWRGLWLGQWHSPCIKRRLMGDGHKLQMGISSSLLPFTVSTSFKPYKCCRDSAVLCNRMTDATGEIHNLITEEAFPPGVYRVDFDTKSYWKSEGSTPFHEVTNVSVIRCHSSVCTFLKCTEWAGVTPSSSQWCWNLPAFCSSSCVTESKPWSRINILLKSSDTDSNCTH